MGPQGANVIGPQNMRSETMEIIDDYTAKIVSAVDRAREEVLQLSGALIRAPSENPPCDQSRVMEVVTEYLKLQGIAFQAPYLNPQRKNVVARLESGGGPRSLVLYGHTDTVPVGDERLWSFPPFVGDVRDGWLRGRGAVDMKAGLAASLVAGAILHRLDVPLQGTLILHANPDEEDYIVEEKLLYSLIDEGPLKASACIMAEPSGLDHIGVADKGDLWLRVRTKGRSTHGSSPFLGESAIEKALRAVELMRQVVRGPPGVPTPLRPILAQSKVAARERAKLMGLGSRAVSQASGSIEGTTVNLGRITGGTMVNMVPEFCEVEVALCVGLGFSSAELHKEIRAKLAGLAEVEVLAESEPNFTPPDDPIVSAVSAATKTVLGREAKPVIFPATSDAQVFRPRGIPTLFYGPGDLAMAHALDERISADDVVEATKVFAVAALEYLGVS